MTGQAAHATTPQSPILLRETVGSIAVLTLNRPGMPATACRRA